MNHDSHFLGQALLKDAQMGSSLVLGRQSINLLLGQCSEYLYVAFGILVAHVQPELVELIWRSVARVEPDVSGLCLAELATVGLRNQRAGQCKYLPAVRTANQFGTGGDVTPLVAATHLELAAFGFIQMKEVVPLQQLVGEFREGKTVTCLTVQTLLYRIFRHHIVHSDVLTHFTGKIEESEVLHPIVVVHQLGTVGGIRIKIQELGELGLHTGQVALQRLFRKQIAFGRLSGRVTNHTRSTANQCQRLVSATLEVTQNHHTAKVPDVQRVRSRVETNVCSHLFLSQKFFRTRHHIVEHATPS